ncbi:NTPase-like protein [Nitzschia inconspicua]|uniref:NTPase-like protein n=1 Tax=Nitzschia inconspicua TaxID=303405 RepID=A0A9K3Q4F4_9STRA|nr:NTPase-like protein [Nitzschia inconspicua]
MRLMPPPPILPFEENEGLTVHDEIFSLEALHPCMFPMLQHTPYAARWRTLQDSWEERHLQQCTELLQEISQCEVTLKLLREREIENTLDITFIEEIDDDNSWSPTSVHENAFEDGDESEGIGLPCSTVKPLRTMQLPQIPITILGSILAPLIRDRCTFDNLSVTCKELRKACSSMDPPPPWPEGVLRIGSGIWSIAFSPDGNLLAVGCRDGIIRLLDRRKGILPPLTAHVARVYSIVFHPNSHIMASGSGDGDVRIWDLQNMQDPPIRLTTNSPHIDCLAFNHDGTILASSGDGRIRLWNFETRQFLGDLSDGTSRVVESISFSPDGRSIAGGNWGNRVCLWDVHTQQRVAMFSESTIVHAICWSPDSRYLCSASDSRTLRLWNVSDRSYVSLEGHRDSIWCVAYSPDGKFIASGGDDGTTRIFDATTGRSRATFTGHDDDATVYGVAFSPCNKFVASCGDDGCIEIRRNPYA